MRDDVAHEVVATVRDDQRVREFSDYMERLCDYYGVEHEHGDIDTVILRPGQQMLSDALPGLPEDGMTGTVDGPLRSHVRTLPFDLGASADRRCDGRVGSNRCGQHCAATLRVKALPPGTLLLEALRRPLSRAARLQIQRFCLRPASVSSATKPDVTSQKLYAPTVDKLTRGVPPTTALEWLNKHAIESRNIIATILCSRKPPHGGGGAR